jgi:HPt (histidine-containing phosphotransfer) domain-containing protein
VETVPETHGIKQIEEKMGEPMAIALATAFLDDTKGMLEVMGNCVKTKDSGQLRLLTHKLLGVSASIMDKETYSHCRTLEDLGADQSWETAAGTYDQLYVCLTNTREALQKFLETKRPKA